MPKNEWDDIQLEDFTLEDVLLEFGSSRKESPTEITEKERSIIDQEIFDEIKNENKPKEVAVKKPVKKQTKFSTLDILRRKAQAEKEKRVQVTPHAVPAEREAPVREPRKVSLDETLNLNNLFENKNDYDDMSDKSGELPGEYVVRNALKTRGAAITSIFSFILSIVACYFSFAEAAGLPMIPVVSWEKNQFAFILVLCAMHALAIILNIRVFWRGIIALFTFKSDMYSMLSVSSVATLAHAAYMLLSSSAYRMIPYNAVCIVMLFFGGLGNCLRRSGRLRSCKAASASKAPYGVFISERDGDINLLKHPVSEIEPFTKYVQMPDGAERYWSYLAPILIVAALLCSIIASIGTGNAGKFFWAFAAITTVSTPFFITLCYALPYSKIAKKLATYGAAIAGWYAAFSMSGERKLIIRDSDIFPKGTVVSHGLKVFGGFSLEKVVRYATSIVTEAKSGLAPVFDEILKSQYGKHEKVSHLLHHESGGMEAEVCGDHVLLGTEGFILRMGVRILEKTSSKNTMYLSINGSLAAAFNLKYTMTEDVKISLENVIRGKLHPVMASIDCNQTPIMIENELYVKKGSIEYPSIEERLDLASDDQYLEYDPAAFVTRAGLAPFANSVLASRRLRKITIRNVVLSTICAVVGLLVMAFITYAGKYDSGAAYNILLYMLLWTVPVYLLSSRIGM